MAHLLTIFTCPKPFNEPHIRLIQRNAIRSWTLLVPRPRIILMGGEAGSEEVAVEFGAEAVAGVERSLKGTPLVSSLFRLAEERSGGGGILAYVNTDIILMQDFIEAVDVCAGLGRDFLMVGRRWDLEVREALDFGIAGWDERLRERVRREGRLHEPSGLDYFVFSSTRRLDIPQFALGRGSWDNWLLAEMGTRGVLRIDATADVVAVHQNHAPGWVNPSTAPKDSDEWRNRELACGHYADAWDCEFELVAGRVRLARSREHLERRVETWAARWPWLPAVLPSTKLRHAAAWVENAMRGYGRIALSR